MSSSSSDSEGEQAEKTQKAEEIAVKPAEKSTTNAAAGGANRKQNDKTEGELMIDSIL